MSKLNLNVLTLVFNLFSVFNRVGNDPEEDDGVVIDHLTLVPPTESTSTLSTSVSSSTSGFVSSPSPQSHEPSINHHPYSEHVTPASTELSSMTSSTSPRMRKFAYNLTPPPPPPSVVISDHSELDEIIRAFIPFSVDSHTLVEGSGVSGDFDDFTLPSTYNPDIRLVSSPRSLQTTSLPMCMHSSFSCMTIFSMHVDLQNRSYWTTTTNK